MSTHAMFWAIVLLGFVALITMQLPDSGNRLRDFNFGTGVVNEPCKGLVMADCGEIKK